MCQWEYVNEGKESVGKELPRRIGFRAVRGSGVGSGENTEERNPTYASHKWGTLSLLTHQARATRRGHWTEGRECRRLHSPLFWRQGNSCGIAGACSTRQRGHSRRDHCDRVGLFLSLKKASHREWGLSEDWHPYIGAIIIGLCRPVITYARAGWWPTIEGSRGRQRTVTAPQSGATTDGMKKGRPGWHSKRPRRGPWSRIVPTNSCEICRAARSPTCYRTSERSCGLTLPQQLMIRMLHCNFRRAAGRR